MGQWRSNADRWLSSEPISEEAVDAALSGVFGAVPRIRPSEAFVHRAVQAAWRVQAQRRRNTALMTLAASLMAALAGVTAYGLLGGASGWLLGMLAAIATSPTGPLVVAISTAVEWWSDMTRVSTLIAGVVAMPQNTFALIAIEVAAGGALYALHRLLRGDGFRDPGRLCL